MTARPCRCADLEQRLAELERWKAGQEEAWAEFRTAKTAIGQAREDQQRAAFRGARRSRSRARSARPLAASSHLSVVAPGGAA